MLLPINVRRHLRSPYTSHSLEEKKKDGGESMLIGKKTMLKLSANIYDNIF